jgi:hypothetical protein
MSWKSGRNAGRAKTSWSGKTVSGEATQYRWRDSQAGLETHGPRSRWHGYRWAFVTLISLALVGLLISQLIPKKKTLLIFIAATHYESPVPLNPWAIEDGEALGKLTKNLLVTEYEPGASGAEKRKGILPQSLNPGRGESPVIVYVCAHGVVSKNREPCLLFPGISTDAPERCRVSDLLDEINEKVPKRRNALLILDCNRIRANWSMGIIYNTFFERVEQLIKDKNIPRLAVLMSAGPGQTNWTSADFGGSIFARYLQLGLAGEAGNSNHEVTLKDLEKYLKEKIGDWSLFNRGERQEPVLITAQSDTDFHVAEAGKNQEELIKAFQHSSAPPPTVSDEVLEKFWGDVEGLRGKLRRFDPTALHDLEHRLLRLEELSRAGKGYADQAKLEAADDGELKTRIKKANEYWEKVSKSPIAVLHGRGLKSAYSTPACKYFGVPDRPGQLIETELDSAVQEQQISQTKEVKQVLQLRKDAEELAVPSEVNGLPGDERAHYYTRAALEKADDQRRVIEDLLFIGDQIATQNGKSIAQKCQALTSSTAAAQRKASEAFTMRDQTLAENPYLAAWLCDPLCEIDSPDNTLRTKFAQLLEDANKFDHEINQVAPGRSDLSQGAIELIGEFEALKNDFNRAFDASVSQADQTPEGTEVGSISSDKQNTESHEAGGAKKWRQLEAALHIPLNGSKRKEWLKRSAELTKGLHEAFFAPEGKPKKDEQADQHQPQNERAGSFADSQKEWVLHPLLSIVQVKVPSAKELKELKPDEFLNWCDDAAKAVRENLKVRTEVTVPHNRNDLWPAESALRAKGALMHVGPEHEAGENDAIERLLRYDIQQLLIWNAQRAIKDFWQDKNDGEVPFFARAARNYVEAAKELEKTSIVGLRDQIAAVEQKLQMKGESLPLKVTPGPSREAEEGAEVSVTFDTQSFQFPYGRNGYAAIQLVPRRSGPKKPPPIRTWFVDWAAEGGKRAQFTHNIADANRGEQLDAAAFFRGRVKNVEVVLPKVPIISVKYQPANYRGQSVTLSGKKENSSIDIILDWSGSMSPRKHPARMPEAKVLFEGLLHDILERNKHGEEIDVGVWFFGHRIGWADEAGTATIISESFAGQKTELKGLGPADDVERILAPHKFNAAELRTVQERMNVLRPFGETPLYLAIKRALAEDFANGARSSNAYIVAITDGQGDDEKPINAALKAGVVNEWQKTPNVRVYLWAIDTPPLAADPLKVLADDIKGTFVPTNDAVTLKKTRDEILPDNTYSIAPSGQAPRSKAKLNDQFPIDDSLLHKDLAISFKSVERSLRVDRGEAISLEVRKAGDGKEIVGKSYEEGMKEEMLADSDPPLKLRLYQPQLKNDAVEFQISLQRDPPSQYLYTPRPAETWLEITPEINNVPVGVPYVFYDTNFEPGTPVPVLTWTAYNWPKNAKHARINFWCKDSPSEGAGRRPLSYFLGQWRPVGSTGVNLSAKTKQMGDQWEICIEEQHTAQSQKIDDLRIKLELDSSLQVQPTWVEHQFKTDENGVAIHAIHRYQFPARWSDKIRRSDPGIVITKGADAKRGALHLEKAWDKIPVSSSSGVHTGGEK